MVVLIKAIGMALPSLPDSQGASAQLCVNILSVLFWFALVSFFNFNTPITLQTKHIRISKG